MRRWVYRFLGVFLLTLGLLAGTLSAPVEAQPYSAQIQRALNAFVAAAHTWTATQTFTNITINGTCTGCTASPATTVDTLTFNVANPDGTFSRRTAGALQWAFGTNAMEIDVGPAASYVRIQKNNAGTGFIRTVDNFALFFGANDSNKFSVDGNGVFASNSSSGQSVQLSGPYADGTTSTDGIVVANTTAATVGTTVQISRRGRFCGTAYNSVSTLSETNCMVFEALPVTNAGTTTLIQRWGQSINGGAVSYGMSLNGNNLSLASGGSYIGGNLSLAATGNINFTSRNNIAMAADGLVNVTNSGVSVGPQFNVGTAAPTVTTCGTGSVTAHSNNMFGEITATGATSCTVTFGLPNWSFQPFCVIEDETSAVAQRISAISVSAFTVTALTSGDKFMYHCGGGAI